MFLFFFLVIEVCFYEKKIIYLIIFIGLTALIKERLSGIGLNSAR